MQRTTMLKVSETCRYSRCGVSRFAKRLVPCTPIAAATGKRPAPRRSNVQRAIIPEQEVSASTMPPVVLPAVAPPEAVSSRELLEFDSVLERELQENGFRSTRRTKMICTIGPTSSSPEVLESLAINGMNVARLNMCHGNHEWHRNVINEIKALNASKGYSIAILLDTEGSEIHTIELKKPIKAEESSIVVFTIRNPPPEKEDGVPVVGVSYESFIEDVEVGDTVVVDGGMVVLEVVEKAGPDVKARTVDPGLILSRANLTFRRNGAIIRGRNSMLPVISAKDWMDIDFAISEGVDFLGVSFVKNADVIKNLRSYIQTRGKGKTIEIVAKIESYDSISHLDEIIEASDGVMVARGDLGAQIPIEDVPSVQKYIVLKARQLGKPSIVAAQLLQSMIEYPIPTRAEVADVADVVRQRADALMLSGESAMGKYPEKALGVLRAVATRMEEWVRQERYGTVTLPQIGEWGDGRASEEICASAATIANNLEASAIFAFTRRGNMASLLSRCRPDCPIFAFTDSPSVRQRLNMRWGVMPFRIELSGDSEENIARTFKLLQARGFVQTGDLVVVVSDLRVKGADSAKPKESDIVRGIQVRRVT